VDERQERVGRNEALFRVVNERIERLNEVFAAVADDVFEIVCECGDMTCVEQIQIRSAEYERVRADPTLFIIAPGHEDATVEAVVEEVRGAYVVVRKHPGDPANLAARRAPD
jgi:hypothetical protein